MEGIKRKRSVFSCNQSEEGNKTKVIQMSDVGTKTWKFRVVAKGLKRYEKLCLSGDCEQLGNWKHDKVLVLNREDQENDLFSISLQIPAHNDVHFRYCVCLIDERTKEVLVTRWETHLKPRSIKIACTTSPKDADVFGSINNEMKIDQGWLSSGFMTQFKFYKKPFVFFKEIQNFKVKLTPVDSGFNSCDFDVLDSEITTKETADNVISQVAVLNKDKSHFKDQSQLGEDYADGDFLIFNVTTCTSEKKLTYVIAFYDSQENGSISSHIGYCYVMPDQLKGSEGEFQLPIICPNKHRPMGFVHGEYLVIRPTNGVNFDMEKSYCRYWKQTWVNLDVGHRGNGSSFKTDHNIVRENTIASINTAKDAGADFVEFDVQLSKDLIPVIYHDFDVCLSIKNKNNNYTNEVLQVPLKDLTLNQLQTSKVYHVGEEPNNERFHDTNLIDNQPFQLLADFLNKVDLNVGFNVEIKWPMKQEDGYMPLSHSFDMNIYLNKILDVIFCYGSSRKIFFSCFNPEVCVMLSMKQNLYPVMFLTQGITNKWPKLFDPRCNTIQYAIFNALNSNLLGIVVHTEDLLRDSSQIISTKNAGLVLLCWGDDNNNKDVIKALKESGIQGVIFDRMDLYSAKEVKESIFSKEEREKKAKMMKVETENEPCS